jgi:DNA-binding SARP family transcriptional activator
VADIGGPGTGLRIRLFGDLDVRVAEERLPPIESARARSLLAYLVLHEGVPQARQRLAFLLWPDSSESQARTNLRHLLHTLRSAVPALAPHIDLTPQTLCWRRATAWTDVVAFDDALARAGEAEPAGPDEVRRLRNAVELYAGDLLEDCYDDWLLDERARRRDRYLWALRRLTGLVAGAEDHGEAVRLGRELLRLDPLREDSYRLLMRIHAAAGDRAAAMHTYHECVTMLRRELAVEPSPMTTEAYAALMAATGGPSGVREDPPSVGAAALVGREDEWRQLTEAWQSARRGQAQLLLVTGEPGIGKTRLAEDLSAWCAHNGATVASGRSYAGEADLAYGLVLAWLRAPAVAAHLRRAPARDLAELARLLPELGEPGIAEVDDVAAPARRRRLFEAVGRVLTAPGRPTVLVADDAQWCDAQSLAVIQYLLRLDPSPPLLVAATVRRDDLDDDHALGALNAGLQAIGRLSEITLDRLAPDETATLARRLLGARRSVGPAALDALHAETEGNPLFIIETVRAGWDGTDDHVGRLSPRLQAVIDARLRQVSDTARRLLRMAATVGREFTADVLGDAAGLDEVALVQGLDELWRRGLIRDQGTATYDFSHGRIRDVAYGGLRPAERARNHRLIADTLIRLQGSDADAGEIARHLEHGGRNEAAVEWYRRAATQAQRVQAAPEAVRLLDRASALVVTLPDGPARRRQELAVLSALPTSLASLGGFASPRLAETQRRVLELAAQTGTEPDPVLLRSLVMSSLCRRDFEGARGLAGRLRDWAVGAGDDTLLAETEYLLGISAFWAGAFDAAREHFERVEERFDRGQRSAHLLRFGHDPGVVSLSRLANTLWFLGRVDDARLARDRAIALAVEAGDPFSSGVAAVFAALLSVDLGEPATYQVYVAGLHGGGTHRSLVVASEAYLGYADVLAGDVDRGIVRIRRTIDASAVDHAPGQRATYLRLLVAAYDAAGDAAGGVRAAEEAMAAPGTRIWDGEHRRLRDRFLAAVR